MIYKIRIILDTNEDIFRDLEIEEENTLEDLHNAVTQAFGFLGQEMASFYTCDQEWQQDEEIALFDMGPNEGETRLMTKTTIGEVLNQHTPKLIYVYDFMSMWTFFVELADIVEKEDGRTYPNVLFSFGEIPDTPPEKNFEAENQNPEDSDLDYDDEDINEEWN